MARTPNLIEKAGLWLARRYVAEAIPELSGSVDADDYLYRRVTDTRRDLNPVTHRRAQEISLYLWRQNPMARRVVEMIADFTVGADGLRFEGENDRIARAIDEFWNDPVAKLGERFRDLVRDEALYGELAFRKATNETSGHTRLGMLDPFRIKEVRLDEANLFIDREIVLAKPGMEGAEETLKIVNWDDADGGRWVGDAHFFAVNRVTGQQRGTPDLFAIADFIDGWDQLLFNALERSALINAFIFDVTLEGADDGSITKWLAEHGDAPRPGSLRVHNEKEKWRAEAPQLGSQDVMTIGRAIKNAALGGAGMPEAWFAEGDSANRATLAAQGDPTYRMLQSRQTHIKSVARTLVTTYLQEQTGRGLRESRRNGKMIAPSFRVLVPDISAKDTSTLSAALPQVSAALSTAVQELWIDKKSSRSVFISMVNQLGVDLDLEDVEAAIEKEQAEIKAKADAEAKAQADSAASSADVLDRLLQAPAAPQEPVTATDAVRVAQKRGGQPKQPATV